MFFKISRYLWKRLGTILLVCYLFFKIIENSHIQLKIFENASQFRSTILFLHKWKIKFHESLTHIFTILQERQKTFFITEFLILEEWESFFNINQCWIEPWKFWLENVIRFWENQGRLCFRSSSMIFSTLDGNKEIQFSIWEKSANFVSSY